NDVAHFSFVLLIMSLKFLRVFYTFAIKCVLLLSFNHYCNGFVHFVRHNTACVYFALVTLSHTCKPPLELSVSSTDFSFMNHSFHTGNRFTYFADASSIF